jgi:hypothetical protein
MATQTDSAHWQCGHSSRTIQNSFGHSPLRSHPHPPYSSHISPSYLYPFGKVKSVLIGREIPDEMDLPETVTEISNGISDAEMQHVFRGWIERVETVINAGVNYLTE